MHDICLREYMFQIQVQEGDGLSHFLGSVEQDNIWVFFRVIASRLRKETTWKMAEWKHRGKLRLYDVIEH